MFPPSKMVSNAIAYDTDCIYHLNLITQFTNNHPDVLNMLDNDLSTLIIPAVHIRNHKEACWYTYGGVYTPCIGHFYGEMAEMIWPFMNQFAGQTWQMTNGHRQDTIIRNLGAWNWCKVQWMCKCGTPIMRTFLKFAIAVIQLMKELREYMKRKGIIFVAFARLTKRTSLYSYYNLKQLKRKDPRSSLSTNMTILIVWLFLLSQQ
jgi:hypothetical protein